MIQQMNNLLPGNIPSHIAVIMDGNNRWAKMRGLGSYFGHHQGAETAKKISRYCSRIKVGYLSLFAFSTENWQRPDEEVEGLMKILVEFLEDQLAEMNANNIRFRSCGRRDNFSPEVNAALDNTTEKTGSNTGLHLILCLDYGGRQEIIDAANRSKFPVTEDSVSDSLYLPDVPDVDLLIRTSGQERISNFMLWQASYSELYFTDVLWPDFDVSDMESAIKAYGVRSRTFGLRI
jgi:undecaprenyl diphosphate synthase